MEWRSIYMHAEVLKDFKAGVISTDSEKGSNEREWNRVNVCSGQKYSIKEIR